MNLDKSFANKVIVKNIDKQNIAPFIRRLIENAWLDHDVPEAARVVKQDRKLTLDMLPKTFNVETVVNDTMRKGILSLEKIGVIPINLKITLSSSNDIYRIDIDKFAYEANNYTLQTIVEKTINDIG